MTMGVFRSRWKAPGNEPEPVQSAATPFYAIWDAVARFAQEIRASDFMAEMIRRRDAHGSEGVMARSIAQRFTD